MTKNDDNPIVSSNHLASGEWWELSELEYGLIVANNAFSRWAERCMGVAGMRDLSALEVCILHHLHHRDREKKLSEVCFVLNIEDTHTVNYAIKKLVKQELVEGQKRGKEVFYSVSEKGKELCRAYKEVRQRCLLNTVKQLGLTGKDMRETAKILRILSGQYDQASRVAGSF